jgi:PTH1 family peptidyl-tRNA hydrolase
MIPARVAQAVVGRGVPVVLVQPWTFMNRTGRVLGPLMERFGEGASLLLVTDDLALPVGRIRIRERGSAGGHNGLKSITSALGSENYSRIRVGIGSESSGDAARLTDTKDYVLSVVRRRDRDLLERAEDLAADAVECVIREGVQSAMARFNGNDLREQRDT